MKPTLYPLDRDLSKTWFIKYKDQKTGLVKKIYGSLKHLPTVEDRETEAQRIIADELNWHPMPVATPVDRLPGVLEQYLGYRVVGLAHKSVISYTGIVQCFCRWYRLNCKNPEMEVVGMEYLRHLYQEGISATTRNNHRALLTSLFKKIVKAGKLPHNPFDNTQKARERRETKNWYRPEQIDQLKQVMCTEMPQLWLACRLIFYCFIRPGNEMRHLQVMDIDIAQNRIRIKAKYSKSGKQDEFVMIPAKILADLAELKKYPPHYYLFTLSGKPGTELMSEHILYKRHAKILKELKYPKGFSLYSWKNTGAVMMLQGGVNLVYISKMMRHKSFDYTREYFKSLGFDDFNHDVNKLLPDI